MKNKEFILPKSWCVKIDNNNKKPYEEWRFDGKRHDIDDDMVIGYSYHFYSNKGSKEHGSYKSFTNFFDVEITQEQFFKYVLKINYTNQQDINEDYTYLLELFEKRNIK